jgi:MoaA/NifB/PqqE/SkfB family radical SAM enzyme
MKRDVGYMDMGLYRKIIDEITGMDYSFVRMVGQGEPSTHPHFREMMNYIGNNSDMKKEVTTNGLLLNLFSSEEIISWNLDVIGISVDGYNSESYMTLRPNSEVYYDTLKKKVANLYETKRMMNKQYPKIRIRKVMFPDDDDGVLRKYKDEWSQYADLITFNVLMPLSPASEVGGMDYQQCNAILSSFHIRWDGRVPLCGYQLTATETHDNEWIGDVRESSIREIWKSARLEEVRHYHRNKDLGKIDFCRRCLLAQKTTLHTKAAHLTALKSPVLNILNRIVYRYKS